MFRTKILSPLFASILILAMLNDCFSVAHADVNLSGWQKGIDVQSVSTTDYASASFQQSMRNAANDGVNYVSLIIPLQQTNIYSSDVQTTSSTPTDQALGSAIQYIHSLGMHAAVSVHDDPEDGQWRALINPTNRTTWFAAYSQLLNHYADIAAANNAEELVIGTEMSSLTIPSYSSENTPGWIAMIQSVRRRYHGLLTYGAEHAGYMSDDQLLGFWSYLDEIGISAYYSMGNSSSTIASMEADWAQIDAGELKGLASMYGKPLIFIEVGYVSGDNSLSDPGAAYVDPGNVNLMIQANAYQALLAYWSNSSYMVGASFWDWSSNPTAGGNNDTNYTPQNKPAEQVMKQWFTTGGISSPISSTPATYAISSNSSNVVSTGSLTGTLVNLSSSQPQSNVIVDLEIYNTSGVQVSQTFYPDQNLTSTASSYQISWQPSVSGQYTLKVGVFSANWQSNLTWNGAVSTITASVPATITVPVIPASINIWWPSGGSGVSGVQPFKALVNGMNPAAYTMYWQVDGGQLNPMTDNSAGGAHKEADVDLSGWNWHGNGGQYVINFVAKDLNGNSIAQKSTTITIYN